MEKIHQAHLSNVLSFLHRKNTVAGFKPLKHAIQIQLRRSKPPDQAAETKKLSSMCARCFTHWKEGNFSVKFKPKFKHGKNISKRMVLKCLVCGHKEYQSYNHIEAEVSIDKKIKPITKKKKTLFKSKSNKNTTKLITSEAKTKTINNSKKHLGKNKPKRKVKKK